CETVSLMLGTDFTIVLQHDRTDDNVVVRAADGALQASCGLRMPADACAVPFMAEHRQAVVSPELSTETRFPVCQPAFDAGARSSLRVLIPDDDGHYGILATYSATPRDYSQSE